MVQVSETICSDDKKIVLAETFEDVKTISNVWNQMLINDPLSTPDVQMERYLSVIKASKDNAKPYVLLLGDINNPEAMVIGRIETHSLPVRLGYKTLLNPKFKCLSIVYGGILGQPESDNSSLIIDNLLECMGRKEFDLIYFNHLNTETSFYHAVRKTPLILTKDNFPKIEEHWRMSLPNKIDEFYAGCSKKHRGNLRRYIRNIDELSSSNANFITFDKENQVDEFVSIASRISERTYQYSLGAGVINDERTRNLLKDAARQGWLNGVILKAGDQPCAFQLGFNIKEIYYLVNIGYDPSYSSYNVGTVLFIKVLESLCSNTNIKTIDFYFGEAQYKKQFGTEKWQEASIYLFAHRAYPIYVNSIRNCVLSLDSIIRYFVNKTGAAGKIKRQWRNIIQPGK